MTSYQTATAAAPDGRLHVLVRVAKEFSRDNIVLAAAGLAFYAMLAIFPALLAIVSLYGVVADPADVQRQLQAISGALPPSAQDLIGQQLTSIVSANKSHLSWGLAISLAGFLWSAASGTKSLLTAINIPYHQKEERGFFQLTGLAFAFTIGLIIATLLAVGVITVLPSLVRAAGLGDLGTTVVTWLRWPALVTFVMASLAVLYTYGPSRPPPPRIQWISWGAAAATALWTAASLLFSWYAASFGKLNQTYGTLGAVIALLMWFYISALAILIGAVINAQIEQQRQRVTLLRPAAHP